MCGGDQRTHAVAAKTTSTTGALRSTPAPFRFRSPGTPPPLFSRAFANHRAIRRVVEDAADEDSAVFECQADQVSVTGWRFGVEDDQNSLLGRKIHVDGVINDIQQPVASVESATALQQSNGAI
jgi:hypothetical protein